MNGNEKKQFLTFGIAGHIVAAIAISFAVYGYVMAQVDEKIESKIEQVETAVQNNKEEIVETREQLSRQIKIGDDRIAEQIKTLIEVLKTDE